MSAEPSARLHSPGEGVDFTGLLLAGIVLLLLTLGGLVIAVYVGPGNPAKPLVTATTVAVASEVDFPVGASRIVNRADRIILVVRRGEREYYALQGTAPTDGCILRWDDEAGRVTSPCNHLLYDVRGNAVAGLSTEPLRRYAVVIRDGFVYVTD